MVKDPTQTEHVFALSAETRKNQSPLLSSTLDFILAQPGFAELYRTSYNPTLPAIDELLRLPETSLGRALGQHMKSNGLQFDFFVFEDGSSLQSYVVNRGRKMHDIWHVLSGYDVSVCGELGLQGFTYAQLRSPFSALLFAGGILHCLSRNPAIFTEMMRQVFSGYQMGCAARPLIGLRQEERLGENLETLRAELQITTSSKVMA